MATSKSMVLDSEPPGGSKTAARPVHCAVCRGRLEILYEAAQDPQTGEHFAVERCVSCGLGHTVPQPEDLGPYYGAAYYGGRHGFTADFCAWRRTRILDGHTRHAGRLLDVGCGEGEFLAAAQRRGWRGIGTEIGAAAQRAIATGLDVRGSLAEAALDGPYDAITLWHSLEHLRDPRSSLDELRSLLARDGRVFVAVPDAGGYQATVFGKKWFHLDVPRHLFHFDRRSLATLLEACGFRACAWGHQELELDLFGWIQSALNTVLPRPNALFQLLTGKPGLAKPVERVGSVVLGALLGPAAIGATAGGTLVRRGGTLIVVAKSLMPNHNASSSRGEGEGRDGGAR